MISLGLELRYGNHLYIDSTCVLRVQYLRKIFNKKNSGAKFDLDSRETIDDIEVPNKSAKRMF